MIWYSPQTYGIAVLVFGAVYWLCFQFYLYLRKMKFGVLLEILREPIFRKVRDGELLQEYEIVKVRWTRYIQGEKRESTIIHLKDLGNTGYETGTSTSGDRVSKRMSGARQNI